MALLSDSQLAGLLAAAGASQSEVALMVAIALAESGGYTDHDGDVALETSQWGPSVSPWQIRSLNSQKGSGGERDEITNRSNPAAAAQHAMQIYRESGPGVWSTYTSGKYLLYKSRGDAVKATAPDASAVGSADGTTGATTAGLGGLGGDLKNTISFFTHLVDPKFWKRVGVGVLGAAIIIGALYLMFNEKEQEVMKQALGVTSGGSKGSPFDLKKLVKK